MPDLTADKLDPNNDYAIECTHKHCGAQIGEPCKDLPANTVHFARRLKRLLLQVGKRQ